MVNSGWFCDHGKQALTDVGVYIFSTLRVGFIVQDIHIEVAEDLNGTFLMLLTTLYPADNAAMNVQCLLEVSSWSRVWPINIPYNPRSLIRKSNF